MCVVRILALGSVAVQSYDPTHYVHVASAPGIPHERYHSSHIVSLAPGSTPTTGTPSSFAASVAVCIHRSSG